MEQARGLANTAQQARSVRVNLGVPLACFGIAVLFLFAHLLPGATTKTEGFAPLNDLDDIVSQDNIVSAIQKLAGAQAWLIVIIVAGLSGIWPYLKLLGTALLVSYVESGRIQQDAGYKGLLILEALGKWSYADVFLITTNVLVFNASTGGEYRVVGFGKFAVDLYVTLHFAVLALIIAVTLSSVVTKWAIFEVSEQTQISAEGQEEAGEAESRPLLDKDHGLGDNTLTLGWARTLTEKEIPWVSCGCLAFAAMLCTIIGACVPYMQVVRAGFLGKLIRPEEDQVLNISIFSTARKLAEGDGMHKMFAILGLVFSFLMPMLEVAGLAACAISALQIGGVSAKVFRYGRVAADICHSFACVDVLLIVALATIAQLHTVVDFNIGDSCTSFGGIMSNNVLMTVAGLGFAVSDKCFEPLPGLQSGFFWLLASVVFRFGAWRFVRV
mmetsp:Transcript_53336/g.88419  ORF Transcript_53336/g.88419 Transcript_53336/m.88419 type:complete len:442 (-) Transcript_53336:25-1350(-)